MFRHDFRMISAPFRKSFRTHPPPAMPGIRVTYNPSPEYVNDFETPSANLATLPIRLIIVQIDALPHRSVPYSKYYSAYNHDSAHHSCSVNTKESSWVPR